MEKAQDDIAPLKINFNCSLFDASMHDQQIKIE
ncbi:hypothetical protein QE439_001666 [Pedobacter agri]|nr:hypothetical protein [Pedobacter agri]